MERAACRAVGCKSSSLGKAAKIFEDNVPGQQFGGVTDGSRLNQTTPDDPRLNRNRDTRKIHKGMQALSPIPTAISPIANHTRQHTLFNTNTHNIHQLMSDI